jgi:large subunit ribosomal protein L3
MEKILGKKIKMSQLFKDGTVIPVTVIEVEKKDDLEKLKEGEIIKATGITKGKGFQGVVKRWSFGGGPKTHGQKNRLRAPGSIGSTAPQRVIPGKKMAGRMGGNKKTILNLTIVAIDKERGLISLKGSVPGNNKDKVVIKTIIKR